MNITRENTGDLTATIRIEIQKQDYEEKFIKQIKEFQHKAHIDGFRPGKVPTGLIRKMYGKAILAEEVQKILSESLEKYIQDEKLELIGSPLSNHDKTEEPVFDFGQSLEFYFDLGLTPEIILNLPALKVVNRYRISVEQPAIDDYINNLRRQHGKISDPGSVTEDDNIIGEITETDAEGNLIPEGIKNTIYFKWHEISSVEYKNKFIGLQKGQPVSISPAIFTDPARILQLSPELAKKEGLSFSFNVTGIFHVEKADINPELFNKAFPQKNITTEEELKEQVVQEISTNYDNDTDQLFYHDCLRTLFEETKIPLPGEFLKRLLIERGDGEVTNEQLEMEYPSFEDSMRYQLIENKLIREYNISVTQGDIRSYLKNYYRGIFPVAADDSGSDERFDSIVDNVMKNKEDVRKINDELYTRKLVQVFRDGIPQEQKLVSHEEFITLASTRHIHGSSGGNDHIADHAHSKDHDHDHPHEH